MFSAYELVDIIISLAGQIDSLFNYWISASFAVIVSSYIAKDHLNRRITISISVLYVLASIMFAARMYFMGTMLQHYMVLAGDGLPANFDTSVLVLSITRGPTFFIGFLITQYYLWYSYNEKKKSGMVDT